MSQTLFTFVSPVNPEETNRLIEKAVLSIGGKVNSRVGYMECSWKRKGALLATKFEFYIGQTIRVVPAMNYGNDLGVALGAPLSLKKDGMDIIWGRFVESLLQQNSEFDLSTGDPEVENVMYSDGEVQQFFTSHHHPSYGKAILGGALFGEAGAVVGAMGGKTNTTSFSRPSSKIYMKVRMSNGRIREGTVSVKSREYNKIMANVQRV
jgi:hypothetical protein